MKKRIVMSLAALAAVSMLCGFDSAETADSLYAKMSEASAEADNVAADMTLAIDGAVNIDDGSTSSSIGFKVDSTMNMDCFLDPPSTKIDATIDGSFMGQSFSTKEQAYTVTGDDGVMTNYVYVEDPSTGEGQWQAQTMEGLDLAALSEKTVDITAADLAEWGLNLELAPEPADVDGAECYQLTTVIDSTTLSTVLDKVSELSGQDLADNEDVTLALSMLDGLKLNVVYYVDASTYQTQKVHMDIEGSDFTNLNAIIGNLLSGFASEDAPQSTAELAVNEFAIDVALAYGEAEEFTVPEEALSAPSSDVSEVLSEIDA